MPKVYIVQEAMRRDPHTGDLRPVHDFRPAAVYGELVTLLGNERLTLSSGPVVHELTRKLRSFGDEDFLLAVGDPIAIGIATAVAARMNCGRVAMLKWDREARQYIKVNFDLN
jgi:hypothetical protein